jgi:myo-inositol-1(or 4)-monophosphatase
MEFSRQLFDSLGDAARQVAVRSPRIGGQVEDKGTDGFDPVTPLDRAIEQAIRSLISAACPDDGICGEEFGWTAQDSRRVWSIDPIDGTRAFICGLPSWATLVGVIDDGFHIAGMIDVPVLDERLIAFGGQTCRNGEPVAASGCIEIAKARLSTTDPFLFDGAEAEAFERVRAAALVTRYGLDALAYARVATGDIDLVVESGLKRYDLDALVAVVRGAGGAIGDWHGGEDWDGGRIVAAASQPLYETAVALLSA